MPKVGARHFAYTPKGKMAARKAKAKLKAGKAKKKMKGY